MNKFSNHILAFGLLSTSLLMFSACNTTKKAAEAHSVPVVEETVKPAEFNKLYEKQFVYNTFSGKAQMHYVADGQDQNFTANLRMEKGKKIWLSAIAMGIAEVARAQVTPKKLQAIVRLNKSAYDMSFEEGIKKLNAPVEFPMLENLLIGNPVMQNLKIKDITTEGSQIIITTEKDDYIQTLMYDKTTQNLSQQTIFSESKKFKCVVQYKDYTTVGGQAFAKYRQINIDDLSKNKKILLEMDFSKYDLNVGIDTQFSIPSAYKIKSL